MDKTEDASEKHSGRMGLFSASAVVTASMIGAGVYTTSGYSFAALGSPGWVMLAWCVGGVIALCGAVCYGALAQRFTESGGEYLFLARAVHPAAGMTAGWVSLLAGFTGAIAFAATALESYARSFDSALLAEIPGGGLAIFAVLLATAAHSTGLHNGTQIQNALVIAKFILIAVILGFAISVVGSWNGLQPSSLEPSELPSSPLSDEVGESTFSWGFALVFANALTWISLSYSGFNAAVYMTSEIREPKRNVPRSMIWATIAVTFVYLMLNAVFVYAPTATEITDPENIGNIATVAADSIAEQLREGGRASARWIPGLVRWTILAGLLTSVFALMQTGPRVYQKMCEDGFLPRWIASGPVRPILTQAVLAILIILLSDLREQLGYLGFTLSVSAALCGSLVFFLRNHPTEDVKVAFYPIVPIIYVVGTLVIAALTAYRTPVQASVGMGTLVSGAACYGVIKLAKQRWNPEG